MSELHYGVNVENLLHELSQYESEDIGEFDVYCEDESGREGAATINITLLAADAFSLIGALKAERDALAAENGTLKSYLKECSVVQGEGNWTSDNEKSVYVPAVEWMPETPATDAYHSSVRAEGVEMFALYLAETAIKEGADYTWWKSTASNEACDYAAQLRAGKDGE